MNWGDVVAYSIVFGNSGSGSGSGPSSNRPSPPRKEEPPPKGAVIVGLILGAAIVGLVGFSGGCQSPTLPTITNVNTNTNILNGGGGVTDPNAQPTTCTAEEETPIRVDLNVPSSVAVGESAGIDSTPKSANGKRSDGCNLLQGIQWTATPASVCTVREPSVFNTTVKGEAAGTCVLTACVPGKGACGTTQLVVQ